MKIRVIFRNELPESSSIHWHGFEDQIGCDGMPGISQEPVKPGGQFIYEFTIRQEGTYFYHSHMAMQEMAGMLGAVVMHPKVPYCPHCNKDFLIHLQQYSALANSTTPDTMSMNWNWLLLNGKAGPAATPLVVRQGILCGFALSIWACSATPCTCTDTPFYVKGTEGGRIPETAWWPGNTVLVGVAQARAIEFCGGQPGQPDAALPSAAPHDEPDGLAGRADDPHGGPSGRQRLRGPDSKGITPRGEDLNSMAHMNEMPKGRPSHAHARAERGRAGQCAGLPLANTHLDAGMMGMMPEQSLLSASKTDSKS